MEGMRWCSGATAGSSGMWRPTDRLGSSESEWSLQDGSLSRKECDCGFQLARVTSGTCGSSVSRNLELEEEAEELAPVEEGAQEEGAGSELFGESHDDENDVEVDGEMVFEEDLAEILPPAVVRDPGAPTEKEIAEHSVTHLPHRSWCPICVPSRARDRPHRRVDRSEHALPELHFDYVLLGTRDESETQAIQVMRDTKTRMMFAHHVPKKEMSNLQGAREIIKDVEKLGYDKKWQETERKNCSGEFASWGLKSKRRGRKGGSSFWRAFQGDQGRSSAEVARDNSCETIH